MDEGTKIVDRSSLWEFKGAVDYVDEWFLMGSPWPMLFIFTSYLFFVLRCGPKFMQNRKAYELRKLLMVYNAFQVAFSAKMFVMGLYATVFEFGVMESGCYLQNQDIQNRLVSGHYMYFIAKLTELLDTVFFVLRKKSKQISTLHVYHHSVMFLGTWVSLKYEPSYSFVFLGTLNSFVHIIMYTYYGLSAFPKLEKYLWWKKYITKLQLAQFLMIIIHLTWNWWMTDCPLSYFIISATWGHLILFIYLFMDFYIKNYIKKRE